MQTAIQTHPFRNEKEVKRVLKYDTLPIFIWDMNFSLGDTIREKYRGLLHVIEAAKHSLHYNNEANQFYSFSLIASPTVSSIFETLPEGFEAVYKEYDSILHCGSMNDSWDLYRYTGFQKPEALLRIDIPGEDLRRYYAKIKLVNFVFDED